MTRVILLFAAVTVFPPASFTLTTGAVPKTVPAVLLVPGWVLKASLVAVPFVSVQEFWVSEIQGILLYPPVEGEVKSRSLVMEFICSEFIVLACGAELPYSTSKTALLAFTKSDKLEYSLYL
jgi:hypothetical protein